MTHRVALNRARTGQRVQVVELGSENPARLARLGALGLMPGSWLVVLQRRPALVVRLGETEISLDDRVAREIFVRPA